MKNYVLTKKQRETLQWLNDHLEEIDNLYAEGLFGFCDDGAYIPKKGLEALRDES